MTHSTPSLPISPFACLRDLLRPISPTKETINLSLGNPRINTPPAALSHLLDNPESFCHYPSITGQEEWHKAIESYLKQRFNIDTKKHNFKPHQILPVNGTREGLFLAAQINPPHQKNYKKTLIGLPNPFYAVYATAIYAAGAEPLYLEASKHTGFFPDLESLSVETLQSMKAFFFCSPTNPQGKIASKAYFQELLRLAAEYDFFIIMDECYIDLYDRKFEESPPPSILNRALERPEGMKNVLVFHSLSKRSGLPGLRSGFCVGGDNLMALYKELRMVAAPQTPDAIQKVASFLWKDLTHVKDNRLYYQNIIDIAENIFKQDFEFYRPEGGFFLWLNVNNGINITKMLWQEEGIAVLPGTYLTMQQKNKDNSYEYIRISLGGQEQETISALQKIHLKLQCQRGIK